MSLKLNISLNASLTTLGYALGRQDDPYASDFDKEKTCGQILYSHPRSVLESVISRNERRQKSFIKEEQHIQK